MEIRLKDPMRDDKAWPGWPSDTQGPPNSSCLAPAGLPFPAAPALPRQNNPQTESHSDVKGK